MERGDSYAKRDQFDDVRAKLAKWLDDEGDDPEIDSRIWDYFLDQPELMRAARSGGMAKLVQQYCVSRKHFTPRGRRQKKEEGVEIGPDARSDALGQIAAVAAQWHEWGIRDFRREHLGERLLPPQEIPTWVEEQARREGPAAEEYVLVPIPDWKSLELLVDLGDPRKGYAGWLAAEAKRVAANADAEAPQSWWKGPHYLSYGVPSDREKQIAIRGDRALAELKKLTSGWAGIRCGLCDHIPWRESEAVAFILSGWVSPLPKARARAGFSRGYYPALSRLSIEVDPRLTPKEVAQLYNRMRSRYVQGRDRPMDEKHTALAVFTEQTRRGDASWSELRKQWNAEHSDWAFEAGDDPYAKRFALECRTAWSRVTGEKWGYQWGEKKPRPQRRPKRTRPGTDEGATS